MAEVVNLVGNHDVAYTTLGILNRRLGLIQSIFLAYPATEDYAQAICYRHRIHRIRWSPMLMGVMVQNRKLTLMLGISADEARLHDRDNRDQLATLELRIKKIAQRVEARRHTYAGTLPGIMTRHRLRTAPPERETTARVVAQATTQLLSQGALPPHGPVIVLGARGFVGRRVTRLLADDGVDVRPVDPTDPTATWPTELHGTSTLLLNVATPLALAECIARTWSGMVVLNEVYPEPDTSTVKALAARGVDTYHLAGVAGRSLPRLPGAYGGAIPCCAAWPSTDIQPVLHHLT